MFHPIKRITLSTTVFFADLSYYASCFHVRNTPRKSYGYMLNHEHHYSKLTLHHPPNFHRLPKDVGGCTFRSFGSTSLKSSKTHGKDRESFDKGQMVQVEVSRFGRLGASVDIIGIGHGRDDLIDEDDPVLGTGLILQSEISYFRKSRGMVDVLVGEVLPAYVENVREKRDGDGVLIKRLLDISLRPPGNAKVTSLADNILDKLRSTRDGTLPVGDKSNAQEIDDIFPGASKTAFKKAVSALYKEGKVKPSRFSITLK